MKGSRKRVRSGPIAPHIIMFWLGEGTPPDSASGAAVAAARGEPLRARVGARETIGVSRGRATGVAVRRVAGS